ncbi:hypothetical protein [Mycobacterium sp. NAZ190054]|uniref:hypothetical protein n=1 Tax=Mycobacterium sp. NAZ190054 TaxID=1747766 RepID=UPI0012E35723|nr:hypothetical protein [Mycobacterium sp. NAZ190054]
MAVIDMRTIMLFFAAVHLLLCVLMRWGTRNDASPALATWSSSNFLSAAAWLLIALRDIIPDWASIPVANSLLIFSWALLLVGMQQFSGKNPHWYLAALPACTVFILFVWVPPVRDDLGVRVMVVNGFLLLCLLVLVVLVVRDQRNERLRARLVVLIAVAVAADRTLHEPSPRPACGRRGVSPSWRRPGVRDFRTGCRSSRLGNRTHADEPGKA